MALRLITRQGSSRSPWRKPSSICGRNSSNQDSRIDSLIKVARQHVDAGAGWSGRALITQTWELVLDRFPTCAIKLPYPPLQSITHIKYFDVSGVEQTYSPANYAVDAVSQPGGVVPNKSWPGTLDAVNAVTVRFVCGYGASADDVPEPIKQAMHLMIKDWYDDEQSMVGEKRAMSLLAPIRIYF